MRVYTGRLRVATRGERGLRGGSDRRVDAALEVISPVATFRDQETSRRWQAHYDLIRGRLLAMKIRCYEYNWACAR